MILGIDEAGRGPWAGPLVVGAVVLNGAQITGLNDSKKLTKKRREQLFDAINNSSAVTGLGWVSASELDEIGMSQALRLATRRAVEQIKVPYHEIIIDGTVNFLAGTSKANYVTTIAKADALVPSVSAASIIAKVSRDRLMAKYDAELPGYDFKKHAGYGVAAHRLALEKLGPTPIHRFSFAPLHKYGGREAYFKGRKMKVSYSPDVQVGQIAIAMPTTRAVGNASETAAANFLLTEGYEIIDRNWRNKYCEIDIISRRANTVYFCEVKHRKSATTGDGLDAITDKKLNQMKFAARFYAHVELHESPVDLRLAVIATTGDPPIVMTFLEID